jgi:hypothetical protein
VLASAVSKEKQNNEDKRGQTVSTPGFEPSVGWEGGKFTSRQQAIDYIDLIESYAPCLFDCLGTHASCISVLCKSSPQIKVKGFKRETLRSLWRQHTEDRPIDMEALESWQDQINFVPDAFLIDDNNRIVVCYEVEVGHSLNKSKSKLRQYIDAWWILDYQYWDLQLVSYDGYGNPRLIDIMDVERAMIQRDIKPEKKKHFSLRDKSTWEVES